MDRSSLVSFALSPSVFFSYAFNVATGQSFRLSGNDGKKKLAIGFPCLDCLDKHLGMNVTPSGVYRLAPKSSWDRSADLVGHVRANNMTVLKVKCFHDSASFGPSCSR